MTEILFKAVMIVLASSSVLAGALMILDRVLPVRYFKERHDLALAALFLTPVVFLIALLPASAEVQPVQLPLALETATAASALQTLAPEALMDEGVTRQSFDLASMISGLSFIAVTVWMMGIVLKLAGLASDLRALKRLTSHAEPVSAPRGFTSMQMRLAVSDQVISPMVAGFFRPLALIPTGFVFDAAGRAVLEHEIAHIRRADALTALAQRLVLILFWWAPGVYGLNQIISRSREALCDEEAAVITGQPHDLAHALLDAAARTVTARPLTLAAQPPRKSDLRFRIQALSGQAGIQKRDSRLKLVLLIPLVMGLAFLATPRVGAAVWSSSALLDAVREGDVHAAERILDNGAGVDRVFPGEGTALIEASQRADLPMVTLLLNAGADPNVSTRQSGSPLIGAARANALYVVKALIEGGAIVDQASPQNGTALINAARGGYLDIVQALLDEGADPNGYVLADETPLINAARAGHMQAAQILVAAGADPSLTVPAMPGDRGGPYRSPLSEARRFERSEMVAWLLAQGAEHRPPGDG